MTSSRRLLISAAALVAALATVIGAVAGGTTTRHPAAARTGASATSRTTPASPPFCPGSVPRQVTACVRRDLIAVWTTSLGHRVKLSITLEPRPAEVPRGCRRALRLGTAFMCPLNDGIYVTARHVARLERIARRTHIPLGYAFAATLAHETGHVVQEVLHQRFSGSRDARSRRVEQQADCLGGYWAASAHLDRSLFRAGVRGTLRAITTNRWERRTHGSVAARLAATGRGLRAQSPAACGVRLPRHR